MKSVHLLRRIISISCHIIKSYYLYVAKLLASVKESNNSTGKTIIYKECMHYSEEIETMRTTLAVEYVRLNIVC